MAKFSGNCYKNGPTKTKHPLIGTGKLVKLSFHEGKLINYKQQSINIPQIQKLAPTYNEKGFFFKNEGNISVVQYKENLLAMGETMIPYQFDRELNQLLTPSFLYPSSVHPKIIDNKYWNSYIYGNYLIVTSDQQIMYSHKLEKQYYTHDFFMDDDYMFWFITPISINLQKPIFEGITFKSPTQLLVLNRSRNTFHNIELPEILQSKPVMHFGNVYKVGNNYRIGLFSLPNFKHFSNIKNPWDFTSIPAEIEFSTIFKTTSLLQHHPHKFGDMPSVFEDKTAFISKDTLRIWDNLENHIESRVFDCILEEPIWTHDGHIILVGHYNSKSFVYVLDDKLNIISKTDIPEKLNYSYHGTWVRHQ